MAPTPAALVVVILETEEGKSNGNCVWLLRAAVILLVVLPFELGVPMDRKDAGVFGTVVVVEDDKNALFRTVVVVVV